MPDQIDPMLMAYLSKVLGPRLNADHVQGALLVKGMESLSKQMQPKAQPQQQMPMQPGMNPLSAQQPQPRKPPGPQAGGQVTINKQVPGAGPLRSNTQPWQLEALAALLSSPQFGMQLARLPMMPPRSAAPAQGIPGVPGPQFG